MAKLTPTCKVEPVRDPIQQPLASWGPEAAGTVAQPRPDTRCGTRRVCQDGPLAGRKTDYFATYNWTEEWTMGGQTALMSFWNRPLHAMTDAFTAAGFRISVISEPEPVPAARELFPDDLAAKPRFLCFLFFVLQAG